MSEPQNPYGAGGDPWSGQQPPEPSGSTPAYPAQQPYPQQGYPGYPQPGYAQPGHSSPGYPQPGYAEHPGQQPGYGMPSYPGGPMGGYRPDPGPVPARPVTVSGAFWLWMIIMVVGILANVLLFTGDYFAEVLARAGATDPATADMARTVGKVAVIIGVAVSVFIYLFFGIKMYLGRNWARIVLTVLGGLAVLAGVAGNGLTGTSGVDVARPGSTVILGWVGVVLAAVALVLMYLPDSNRYFAAVKARRMYPR